MVNLKNWAIDENVKHKPIVSILSFQRQILVIDNALLFMITGNHMTPLLLLPIIVKNFDRFYRVYPFEVVSAPSCEIFQEPIRYFKNETWAMQ